MNLKSKLVFAFAIVPAIWCARVIAQTEPDTDLSDATTQPADVVTQSPAILLAEFIFEKAPFPSCHASTIVQTKDGLVAAWFGGLHERAPDVGIWVSRNFDGKWSPVVEVANGIQPTGPRLPCWNPVLFQPSNGPLMLFYKVGPAPATWWGMMMTSDDQGVTWSKPHRLPDTVIGPAKDKPIELSDGSILAPSGVENDGLRLYFDRSTDMGVTWTKIGPLNEGHIVKLEQPTLLDHGGGNLQFLCRSHSGSIYEGWSSDNGQTWSNPVPTELPNPNSGIDAIQLKDGRSLVVYNNSKTEKIRRPLNVAVSADGKSWKMVLIIEDTDGPQLSYPAVIQTRDGLVHITYTWKRLRIRHVVLDPSKL